MKTPRGILDYDLSGHPQSDITWKVTGNLGGEDYADQTRGPLNEGALYAERQGYHLPNPPSNRWATKSPIDDGVSGVGIGLFVTNFVLDIPRGWDVPLDVSFTNLTTGEDGPADYRVQLYVNGYQFGKYSKYLSNPLSYSILLLLFSLSLRYPHDNFQSVLFSYLDFFGRGTPLLIDS